MVSGEWVNEWNVTSGTQKDYQDFGSAQLEVYNAASFGWAYWTLKNDRKHWDFEWNIRNNYLQLGNALNSSSFYLSPKRKKKIIFNFVLSISLNSFCPLYLIVFDPNKKFDKFFKIYLLYDILHFNSKEMASCFYKHLIK